MSATAARAKVSGHYIRKRLATAGLARSVAAFSALLLVASVLVYRLGGIDFNALLALFAVVAGLASLAFLMAVGGLVWVWRSGYEGGGRAVGALFIALLVGAPFGLAAALSYQYPRTNKAETEGMLAADIVDGASISAALSGEPSPEAAADEPPLSSRRFQARAAQVYAVTRTVLDAEGWTMTDVTAGEPEEEETELESADLGVSGTVDIPVPTARSTVDLQAAQDPFDRPDADDYAIKAVARSPILALPSDVTIRIVEDGAETFVDLRSISTTVAWDLGQNRRFIETFLTALDEAMAGIALVVPHADG